MGAGPVVQRLSSQVPLLSGTEFAGSDPWCRHGAAWQKPCCGRHPIYKVEEDGHGCQLRANLPQQKKRKKGKRKKKRTIANKNNGWKSNR